MEFDIPQGNCLDHHDSVQNFLRSAVAPDEAKNLGGQIRVRVAPKSRCKSTTQSMQDAVQGRGERPSCSRRGPGVLKRHVSCRNGQRVEAVTSSPAICQELLHLITAQSD